MTGDQQPRRGTFWGGFFEALDATWGPSQAQARAREAADVAEALADHAEALQRAITHLVERRDGLRRSVAALEARKAEDLAELQAIWAQVRLVDKSTDPYRPSPAVRRWDRWAAAVGLTDPRR